MKQTLKRFAIAAVAVAMTSTAAVAVTVSGAIDIVGDVTQNSVGSTDGVEFVPGTGVVLGTAGNFSSIARLTPVELTNITFASPGEIWSVGGFTFTADSFTSIDFNDEGGKNFTAFGTLASADYDDTPGTFRFSSQTSGVTASFSSSTLAAAVPVPAAGFLLISALIGVGGISARRRKAA